mgnify:CR=1 FL=1
MFRLEEGKKLGGFIYNVRQRIWWEIVLIQTNDPSWILVQEFPEHKSLNRPGVDWQKPLTQKNPIPSLVIPVVPTAPNDKGLLHISGGKSGLPHIAPKLRLEHLPLIQYGWMRLQQPSQSEPL